MIIDSHCHAWRIWPYQPPVPDPQSRGIVEQLLFEMDDTGVDSAAIVCARIDYNEDDNDYIAEAIRQHPDRLYQIADVDCSWTPTYHTPGAANRLRDAIETYHLKGFTHYVAEDDDGSWYLSDEGLEFFRVAADNNQIASIATLPRLLPVFSQLAEKFPSLPFLFHHMAVIRLREGTFVGLDEALDAARRPNISLKLSGFHYASPRPWAFPYPDCQPLVRSLYEHFGPNRLCWGSDYPPVRRFMTYRQSLEAVRSYCDFIPSADLQLILGDSLKELLDRSGR
jgi:predicted TIM-barrel fold metal-dependent hydrolase